MVFDSARGQISSAPSQPLSDQELLLISRITGNLERTAINLRATLPMHIHEAGAAVDSLEECIDYLKVLSHKQATAA